MLLRIGGLFAALTLSVLLWSQTTFGTQLSLSGAGKSAVACTVVFTPPGAIINGGTNTGESYRNIVTVTGGGSNIRVTYQAALAGSPLTSAHISVGVNTTNADTVLTPVELKFGGASGFVIPLGSTLTSDITPFVWTVANKLVVVEDTISGNDAQIAATGMSFYFKAATSSYNQATVTGFGNVANFLLGVVKIESCP